MEFPRWLADLGTKVSQLPRVKSRLEIIKRNFPQPVLAADAITFSVLVLVNLMWTPYFRYLPFPVSILTVIVIYSVFRGGRLAGFTAAALTITYFAYFLKITDAFYRDPGDAWNRLLSWAVALPIIVMIVGSLKRRSLGAVAAKERARELSEITQAMPQIVWTTSATGKIEFYNQHWYDYTGLSSDRHVELGWSVVHPDDAEVGRQSWERSVATGESFEVELRYRRADGVYRWQLCRGLPIRDANGKIMRWVGTSTDINDKKNFQAELATSHERTNVIMANMPAVIWATDANGIFTFSEGAGLKAVGLKSGERVGKSMFDIYPERSEVSECTYRALRGEACATTILINGVWFDISFSPTFDGAGKVTGVVGISFDVTMRMESESAKARLHELEQAARLVRESEKQLRNTTNRLQSLINSSPVGILAADAEGKVTLWNPACEKMFGWTSDESVGLPMRFVPEARREESSAIIRQIFLTREPVNFEADRVKKDGTPIKTSVSAIPLLDEKNQVVGLMAVMKDETERFRQQQEIIETNRALRSATQAKSEFLANMSHEIRTPINGVMGMTGLLLDMELGAEQRSYAETIKNSGEILLTLVNDILDFSKIEAGKLELEKIDFELEHILHNIERMLTFSARKKGLRLLRVALPSQASGNFKGDPTRIGQVLANLISNAIKFTAKGEVVVEIISEKTLDGVEQLRIEVTDTGIGMSPEALSRMFLPFSQADVSTTRRFGGTGLGLSICKHLVELMGGNIGVRSELGKGSTFWFTLLLARDAATAVNKDVRSVTTQEKTAPKSTRILLAEDNSINQLIATKMLEKQGFRVDAVANGLEAIDAVHSFPYDLVLMDCQMPELDGYAAAGRIRGSSDPRISQIPIVAMTANAMIGDREKCLAAGMNDYVIKPIKVEMLLEAIHRNLRKSLAA